jgi:hypothetical protein
MRALWCLDPGGSSGVAWGIVDETKKTAIEAVKHRIHSGSGTIAGPEATQIVGLYNMWLAFKRLAVQTCLLEPEQVEIVIEDFVLFGGRVSGGRQGTMPERIAWGLEGYRMGRRDQWRSNHLQSHYSPVIWQQPGAAARYSNKNILIEADAWVKGRQHERSAFGHMLLRTNTILDNRRHPS